MVIYKRILAGISIVIIVGGVGTAVFRFVNDEPSRAVANLLFCAIGAGGAMAARNLIPVTAEEEAQKRPMEANRRKAAFILLALAIFGLLLSGFGLVFQPEDGSSPTIFRISAVVLALASFLVLGIAIRFFRSEGTDP